MEETDWWYMGGMGWLCVEGSGKDGETGEEGGGWAKWGLGCG